MSPSPSVSSFWAEQPTQHGCLPPSPYPLPTPAPGQSSLYLGGGWGLSICCDGFQLDFLLLGLLHGWLLYQLLLLLWAGGPGRSAGEKSKGC